MPLRCSWKRLRLEVLEWHTMNHNWGRLRWPQHQTGAHKSFSLSGLFQLDTQEHTSQFHHQANTPGFISKVNDTLYQSASGSAGLFPWGLLKGLEKGTHNLCLWLPAATGAPPLQQEPEETRTVQLLPPLPTEIHTLLWGGNEQAEKTVGALTVTIWTHCRTSSIPFTPQFILYPSPTAQELF